VIEAVLLDWGETLFHYAYDDESLRRAWATGFAAVGRPPRDAAATLFRTRYLPLVWDPPTLDEISYADLAARALSESGVDLEPGELERFLEAEHVAWDGNRSVHDQVPALLATLRARGLKLALVSNSGDPIALLRRDLRHMDLAPWFDAVVFSCEVGKRKPHPAVFHAALTKLRTSPAHAVMVGDRVDADVRGSLALGMAAIQATWYRADERATGDPRHLAAAAPGEVPRLLDTLSRSAA
jgi:HAD superfamily hydrolase (TIGR01549 family)